MQELLADEVTFLPREPGEAHNLTGHRALLLERERDRRHGLGEVRPRGGDSRDGNALVGVEQVLHDHHRVVPLLDGLAVEVCGELGQRLAVVVDRDRHVLLRGAELAPDLLVQLRRKAAHRADFNRRSGD